MRLEPARWLSAMELLVFLYLDFAGCCIKEHKFKSSDENTLRRASALSYHLILKDFRLYSLSELILRAETRFSRRGSSMRLTEKAEVPL